MKTAVEKAYGKINLSLDVLRKREDNYHDVRMIMQTVELHDVVSLRACYEGISISCKQAFVPISTNNTAYIAAKLFINQYNINAGVAITLEKNIPISAGLAGGSADGAAVLRGMRTLFKPDVTDNELRALAKRVGSDVPFCISGGTVLAEGTGTDLKFLKPLPPVKVLIIKPNIGVRTKVVYERLNVNEIKDRPDTDLMLKCIEKGDYRTLAANMKNVLETVTPGMFPVINRIKEELEKTDCLGCMMSGSGPSLFALYDDERAAQEAYKLFSRRPYDVFLTKTN